MLIHISGEERISERSAILSISYSASRARPLLPIGFPLHFARALSPVRPEGHIIQRGPLIRGFFVASPFYRQKENLIVDTFDRSVGRYVSKERWFGHNYWHLTLR